MSVRGPQQHSLLCPATTPGDRGRSWQSTWAPVPGRPAGSGPQTFPKERASPSLTISRFMTTVQVIGRAAFSLLRLSADGNQNTFPGRRLDKKELIKSGTLDPKLLCGRSPAAARRMPLPSVQGGASSLRSPRIWEARVTYSQACVLGLTCSTVPPIVHVHEMKSEQNRHRRVRNHIPPQCFSFDSDVRNIVHGGGA